MDSVGMLLPVDIRAVWATEAGEFTPWLAENADLLGEGVIARFVRRITLRSLAASSAKRGVSWDRGSPDGRWCAPRPRSSSRSRRSTRYVPIPTARRAGAGSGPASITPDPVTACASFASTGSDAHSRSCSKPSTASKPTAFSWSASRSASTPRRRPASLCSTSFGSIAHFERRLISERTRDGIAAARARGRTPGQPPLDPETVSAAQKLIEAGLSPGLAAKQLGIGRATAYRIAKTMRLKSESRCFGPLE